MTNGGVDQATKSNIINSLQELIDEARAGEISNLVFSISSHGTQVPDISGDEPDRADEAFCPYDLSQTDDQWDPDHLITDDELNRLLLQVPHFVLVEVFLDTCHSGRGLKGVDLLMDRKPRFLPPPSLEAFNEIENCSLHGLPHQFARQLHHQILWTACRADQTCSDSRIGKTWHGAFTYFLCKVVHENQNRLSRRELLQKIRMNLAAHRYSQIPQLECPNALRDKIISAAETIVVAHAWKICGSIWMAIQMAIGKQEEFKQRLWSKLPRVIDVAFQAASCAKGKFQGPYYYINDDKSMIVARSYCSIRDAAVDEVIFLISDTLDAMGHKIEIIPL